MSYSESSYGSVSYGGGEVFELLLLTGLGAVPLITGTGFISDEQPTEGIGELPVIIGTARTGAEGFSVLSTLIGQGVITSDLGVVVRGNQSLPVILSTGRIISGKVISGTGILPSLVQGFSETGWRGSVASPTIEGSGQIISGAVLSGLSALPRITSHGLISKDRVLNGRGELPFIFQRAPSSGQGSLPSIYGSGVIRLDHASNGIAWCTNMKHGEVTRYTNYDFIDIVRLDNRFYGVRSDGLYLLEGGRDIDTPIDAFIKTSPMDFKTFKLKRVPYVYVGSDTQVEVTAFFDNVQTGIYQSKWHEERVRLNRGPRGRYFALQIGNLEKNMRIERIELLAHVLSRKTRSKRAA